jgi:DtxR family Mn-dependent transcriptional regulator
MLSPAVEDYLKAVFVLQTDLDDPAAAVSTSSLAERLNISPASVTSMLKRLDALNLAAYTSYKGVRLTPAGETIALEIIRHHRLLETYLREVMGYDWEQMHAEAEHLEHHISEEFEDRLDRMLGFPTHDPHGDPIPGRDGSMVLIASEPLPACPTERPLVIRRVTDTDTAMLGELEAAGLLPGTTLIIQGRTASASWRVVLEGRQIHVADRLARHVFASEWSETDS